uniref:Tetraspanin n=1 Tax=Biomphalaria glabrata TaxID=6526 RepID=A0A2C9KZU1_BIOGL
MSCFQLQCCGVVGNFTSLEGYIYYSLNTKWITSQKSTNQKVPESCCSSGDVKICTGEADFNGPPRFFNSELFKQTNPFLYTNGCYDALIKYLQTYSAVVGTVAAVVPLFLVFGIIISFCLCSRVSGYGHDDEVDL